MNKPRLQFWQIWNMSFGFLGIQFGWSLQMGNMSAIYEYLGANPDQIPLLWLAAPTTGLLIQPIIGQLSDNTWGRLGRRRPYFLTGAILSSLALVCMPNSPSLWMAAGLLWILDASINVSMEPFRAFVADLLPDEQRTKGFAMQSFMIGLGSIVAFALPWILSNLFGIQRREGETGIPSVIKLSFYIGAVVIFCAVLWTVLSTKEYPPEDMEALRRKRRETSFFADILHAIAQMPTTMKQLAVVQFFTWLGLFCFWLYFSVAVAVNVLGAQANTELYDQGVYWANICSAAYSLVCFLVAPALPFLAAGIGRKNTHSLCLLCGALGLVSVAFIHDKSLLLLSMLGLGIAWASILSMPYAVLAGSIPAERTGVYMGIFNFFIVLPEIFAALGFGWVMNHLLHGNRLAAVVLGGVFLCVAAGLMQLVRDVSAQTVPESVETIPPLAPVPSESTLQE